MNKRRYVFILIVNILILHLASAGIGNRGYAHHHRNNRKHLAPRLKEIKTQLDDTDILENKQVPENSVQEKSGDDTADTSETGGDELEPHDDTEEGFDEEGAVPERPIKRNSQIQLVPFVRKKLSGEKRQKVEERPLEDSEEDYNSDDDYVRQFPYDPDIPFPMKSIERAKRLIAIQKEPNENINGEFENEKEKGDDFSIEDELYKELKLEEPADATTKAQSMNTFRRNAEKNSLSAPKKMSSLKIIEAGTRPINASVSEPPNLSSDSTSIAIKSPSILSAPKAASNAKATTNGPSQALKNLLELNKAYKLLLCASNKFVKAANRTLMDRMLEECATMNNSRASTTTDLCKTTTSTTEMFNGDCCLKANSLMGTTRKNIEDGEEAEHALAEDFLEITIRPRKKQGQRTNKEVLSWIQNHGSEVYDSLPGLNILPGHDDPNIYIYGDYDSAEDYDEQNTEGTRKSLATSEPSEKVSLKSNEFISPLPLKYASSSKKEPLHRKQIMAKAVLASRLHSSFATIVPSPSTLSFSATATAEINPEKESDTPVAISSSQEKRVTVRHHPRNIKHMRRMKYNKKFLPVSYVQSPGSGIVKENEEAAFSEDQTTHCVQHFAESNVAPQPEESGENPTDKK